MTVCHDGRPWKVSHAIERVAPALIMSEVVQTKEQWLPYLSRRLVTLTSDSHSSSVFSASERTRALPSLASLMTGHQKSLFTLYS
jgi:hypothetical protein